MTPSPKSPDVVVVGGGLVGSALAYELVSAGADTVLIDGHHPGRATDAGAGILSPETHQDPDPDTFALGMASARHYPALVHRLAEDGAPASGFAVTGSLLVSERPGDDATMERAAVLTGHRSPGLVEEVSPGGGDPTLPAARYRPSGPVQPGRTAGGRTLAQRLPPERGPHPRPSHRGWHRRVARVQSIRGTPSPGW